MKQRNFYPLVLLQAFLTLSSSTRLESFQPNIKTNQRLDTDSVLLLEWTVTSVVQCVRTCYVTVTCASVNVSPATFADGQHTRRCQMLSVEDDAELTVDDGWTYIGENRKQLLVKNTAYGYMHVDRQDAYLYTCTCML